MSLAPIVSALNQYLPASFFGGMHRPAEPPLVHPTVPVLGDAVRFGRNAGAYLAALRARHGDVFTVLIAGQRMTFVLDPHDAPRVLKETRDLRFRELADQISMRAFDNSADILNRSEHAEIQRLFNTYLKGDGLPVLGARMGRALLREPPASSEGGLYAMVSRWLFTAGTAVLWGEGRADDATWEEFKRFDAAFPLLITGMPARLLRVETARRRLSARFGELTADASTFLKSREEYFSARGSSRPDQHALMVAILWAALANTIPAAFWTIAHILANPDARAAITQELSELPFPPDEDAIRRLVSLDSAVKEALRLTTGSLVLRQAARDLELELEEGKRWQVRAGDRVCLYPYLSHHDEEIFPDAERFHYDRFLAKDGPPQFFKRGRRLTIPLMPYGGGVSMCPGRFLADQEIKIFAACFLRTFAAELLAPLPALQQGRAGLGIFPPASELRARWRRQ